MSQIERIEATSVRVPLANPPAFAWRRVPAREYTLVRVTDGDGIEGVGFLHAGPSGAALGARAVRDLLAPVLIGQDPTQTERLWSLMYHESLLHGRVGIVVRALSAIDQALWDRNSRAAGLPLWRYLGAAQQARVPTYASGGYYLPGKGPEGLADELRSYVDQGFRAVKIKIGRVSPEEDEERLAAGRDAVGADVEIMLDANNAFCDLPAALRAIRRLERYQPAWIEEPFSPDDVANHRRLAERTPIPVATGEVEGPRWRHETLLRDGGVSILQTDAGVCGGVSEFRRIASMASAHGVVINPHAFHHLHLPLVGSAPNARYVEYFPDNEVVNFPLLVDWQPTVRDGFLELPERPGFGYRFVEEQVERYQLDRWN